MATERSALLGLGPFADGALVDPGAGSLNDDAAAPEPGPRFGRRSLLLLAGLVAGFAALVGVLDAAAPSDARIFTHLNSTCPLECSSTSQWSWLIQFTEAAVIVGVLLALWRAERPRRTFAQFAADNGKSVILALVTHFYVLGESAALGDVTTPKRCAPHVNPTARRR